MEAMKFYTEEEALDMVLGKKGAQLRDEYEADMTAFLMGDTIRKVRQSKKLSRNGRYLQIQ